MLLIKKNTEPKSWTKYRCTPGATYAASVDLVNSLLEEQGYICAYCMRRIPHKDKLQDQATQESLRVEHIKPRSIYPNLQLDYNNMVACCTGLISGTDKEKHCDRLKGNLAMSLSPLDANCIDTLEYRNDGTIYSTDPTYNDEINKVLNLNNPLLKLNRKTVLNAVIKEINKLNKLNKGSWTTSNLTSMLGKYEAKHCYSVLKDNAPQKVMAKTPYCGIAVWYIKRKINKLTP